MDYSLRKKAETGSLFPRILPCLLLLIPLYLLSHSFSPYLPPAGCGFKLAFGFRAAGSLGLVFFLPGIFLTPLLIKKRRLTIFEFLSWSVGWNWLFLLLGTTLIKLSGASVDNNTLLLLIGGPSLILTLPASRRLSRTNFLPFPRPLLLTWILLLAGLLLLAGVSFRPFLISEDRLWPNEYHRLFENQKWSGDSAEGRAVQFLPGSNWLQPSSFSLRPRSSPAVFNIFNPSVRRYSYPLFFLFDSREELQCTLAFNGNRLFRHYFPPPYQMKIHPRNFPPAKSMFSGRVELLPGENVLAFTFLNPGGGQFKRPADILIWNFSGLSREEFRERFRSRYLVADTGDIREQLNLARNLKERILPFTYSYDGAFFDGGGHTIEHPLFPFFLKMLMLVLFEDDLTAFQILFWGLLAALLLVLLTSSIPEGGALNVYPLFLLGAGGALSLFLIRYRIDTPYIGTTLSLTLLLAFYHLSRRESGLFLLWAALALLTKGGPAFVFLGLISYGLVFRSFRYPLKLALLLIPIALAALGPSFIATYREAAPYQWRAIFSGNYSQRFRPLISLLSGDPRLLRAQLRTAAHYFWMVNLGSGFLLLGWFLKKDRPGKYFLLMAVFSYLLVASARSSLPGETPAGHRLSYLAPLIFLIPIPTIRALGISPAKKMRPLTTAFFLLALLAALQIPTALESYRLTMSPPGLEVYHQASVIDFLLRRYQESGDPADLKIIRELFPGFLSAESRWTAEIYYLLGKKLGAAGLKAEAQKCFGKVQSLLSRELKSAP